MSRKAEKERALPDGWQEVRFGDVVRVRKEKTNPATNGSVPCIELENIEKGTGRIITYSSSLNKKSVKTLFFSGDILYGKLRPNLKKYAFPQFDGMCTSEILAFKVNTDIYFSKFIFYLVQSNNFTKIACQTTGTKMPRAEWSLLRKTFFTVPTLPEQKAIASLVETWDTAIEKTEALIEVKEKQFKWLLKTLISDQQGNPEWRKVKLGDVADLYQPFTISKKEMLKKGQYKVFGANGVIGFYDKYNHEEAEIAVVCRGATCGIVNITEPKSWITGNAMVVKPNKEYINKLYLYYLLSGTSLKICISGAAQPQITRKDLFPFLISIPALSQQMKIVAVLEIIQKEIDILKRSTIKYRTQKRGLMQKLLKGEWRLNLTGK